MLAIGVLFAALTLAPGYVAGTGAYWQSLVGDAAKGEIGWFYYARDAWHFPLFAIPAYNVPEGSNALLSDSLPLFALPAKAIYLSMWPVGAAPPIYTGLWVALCFVLQVIAASRLLMALGVRSPAAHLAGLALFSYLPMLFFRFGHSTLLAQFFILLAIEGYVRAKRTGLDRRQWIAVCALPVAALLVHPYLAAMSGALVAVTIADQWRERRLDIIGVAIRFGAIGFAALIVVICGGFLSAADTSYGDYGVYSLNLLSPFVPFPATLSGRWLGTQHPGIPGLNQWEGGSYLGAGVLMLCVAALPALRDWRSGLRRHLVLAIALIAILVFAVSHRIGFGGYELVHIPLPDPVIALLSEFRGSGRFVWVPVYVLLAGVIAAIVHRYRACTALALLAIAAVLQIADVAPMQADVRIASAMPAKATIDRAAWQRLIAAHDRVFQFPSFECGSVFASDTPGTRWRELEVDWIAAELDKPNNSAYLARPTKNCERERTQAASDRGRPGTLYLYRSTEDVGAFLAASGADLRRCGYLDDVVVCSAQMDLSSFK